NSRSVHYRSRQTRFLTPGVVGLLSLPRKIVFRQFISFANMLFPEGSSATGRASPTYIIKPEDTQAEYSEAPARAICQLCNQQDLRWWSVSTRPKHSVLPYLIQYNCSPTR